MSIEIIVPEMGESVIEATVRAWLKKEGDFVEAGEALVELETDKVNLEVGAKASGVLAKIQVAEGQDVKVGDVLGSINADAKQPASKPDPQPASPKPEPLPTPQEKPQTVQPQVTPVASRVAREQNVDVSKVRGTGPDGRVTKSDVQQYAQKQSSAGSEAAKQLSKPSQAAGVESAERREERERMSRRRRTIAQRLAP